jgi:hypothetical protein
MDFSLDSVKEMNLVSAGLVEEAREGVPQPLEPNFSVVAKCGTKVDGGHRLGSQMVSEQT